MLTRRPFPRFILAWTAFVGVLAAIAGIFWVLTVAFSQAWFLGIVLVVYALPLAGLAAALLAPRFAFQNVGVQRGRRLWQAALGNFLGAAILIAGWIGIQLVGGEDELFAKPTAVIVATIIACILAALVGMVSIAFQRRDRDAVATILDQVRAD